MTTSFENTPYPTAITKETKTQWLKDLRNPENKQTQNVLCDVNKGRCCLGVLSDIQAIEKRIDRNSSTKMNYRFASYYDSTGVPPDLFSGLTHEMIRHLSSMNDEGKSFRQIAMFVQSNIFASTDDIRILNHYPDQYYVYVKEDSKYAKDPRFDKNTIAVSQYANLRNPGELVAYMNRRTLKRFLFPS